MQIASFFENRKRKILFSQQNKINNSKKEKLKRNVEIHVYLVKYFLSKKSF